jgi:hypothetical protein
MYCSGSATRFGLACLCFRDGVIVTLPAGPCRASVCPVQFKESIMRNLESNELEHVYGGNKKPRKYKHHSKSNSYSHSKSKSMSKSKSYSRSRSHGY